MKSVLIIFAFSSIIYEQQGYPLFPILQIPEEQLWDAPFSYGLQSCIKPTQRVIIFKFVPISDVG